MTIYNAFKILQRFAKLVEVHAKGSAGGERTRDTELEHLLDTSQCTAKRRINNLNDKGFPRTIVPNVYDNISKNCAYDRMAVLRSGTKSCGVIRATKLLSQ